MRTGATLIGLGAAHFAPPDAHHGTHAMQTPTLSLVALLACAASALAADPLETDPDKYRLVLENDRVRVLEYRDLPGEATHEHNHPDFVLYAISPFERELTFPDGRRLERRFEAGDVMYSPGQTHIGHNAGQTPTHVLMIELKGDADTPSSAAPLTGSTGRMDGSE